MKRIFSALITSARSRTYASHRDRADPSLDGALRAITVAHNPVASIRQPEILKGLTGTSHTIGERGVVLGHDDERCGFCSAGALVFLPMQIPVKTELTCSGYIGVMRGAGLLSSLRRRETERAL